MRKIIHLDLDAFFASVEQLDNPSWRGRPVIVGGSLQRGVVSSASYEARKYGIRAGMPMKEAYRRCPGAQIAPPRMERYRELAERVRALYHEVTPLVEPLSCDEAYLDVTTNLLGKRSAQHVAEWLRRRVYEETGLTASAGVAPLKFVAKIASSLCKPDGVRVVPPAALPAFIAGLPVEALWGVGPSTARRLHQLGFRQVAQLQKCSLSYLTACLGRMGLSLYRQAHGIDNRQVEPGGPPKSKGVERTFEVDLTSLADMRVQLEGQAAKIAAWLQRYNFQSRLVTLKVRYHYFRTISRSRMTAAPLTSAEEISRWAFWLLRYGTEATTTPVRLLGISVGALYREEAFQLRLPFF